MTGRAEQFQDRTNPPTVPAKAAPAGTKAELALAAHDSA